jgi:1,4-dihydroxy-6-naphthoate synthase
MYVNQLTLDYGDRGRLAVQRLLDEAYQHRIIPRGVPVEFAS